MSGAFGCPFSPSSPVISEQNFNYSGLRTIIHKQETTDVEKLCSLAQILDNELKKRLLTLICMSAMYIITSSKLFPQLSETP